MGDNIRFFVALRRPRRSYTTKPDDSRVTSDYRLNKSVIEKTASFCVNQRLKEISEICGKKKLSANLRPCLNLCLCPAYIKKPMSFGILRTRRKGIADACIENALSRRTQAEQIPWNQCQKNKFSVPSVSSVAKKKSCQPIFASKRSFPHLPACTRMSLAGVSA